MICRHCGKEYSDDYVHCPYCAEPNFEPKFKKDLEKEYIKKVNKDATNLKIRAIITSVTFAIVGTIGLGPIAWLIAGIFIVGVFIYANTKRKNNLRPGRDFTINMQFSKDQTSICPKCGSHNIKVYRKGYNYKIGFWGAIFGVRGAGYAGGFDANNTCCRCMDCGKDWETDYDYRLINK
jgi:DNA-directed RNA polymerase subunit RPC12/RpoP